MSSCPSQFRLTIGGTTKGGTCNSTSCADVDPIECCDETIIGPRTKRDNVRQQLHDYILLKLGAPTIDLELDEQQIDMCISEALDVWEEYAPREFYQYYVFTTSPGKSVYQMPPEVGHIRQVYYKEMEDFAFAQSEVGGQVPIEYWYGSTGYGMASPFMHPTQPVYGEAGSWVLYKQYLQQYNRLSSNIGGWEFVGGRNTIKLYPIPCRSHKVMVHYLQKCKDWECNYQAIREGAYASAMITLGRIRSRFSTIPSPGGGVQLDGADLLQRGQDMWDKWEERLITRYGDLLPIIIG